MLLLGLGVSALHLAALAAASPLSKRWDDRSVKHAWETIPKGFQYHGPAPADHTFDLRLGLAQPHIETLISKLYEVSTPGHDSYGQHLSKGELHELARPHDDTLPLVQDWFDYHGIDISNMKHSAATNFVTIYNVTVEQAEKLLGTKYNVYRHTTTGEYVVRTMSYSLPKDLIGHVDVVAPTTYFGTMKSMRATSFKQPELDGTNEKDLNVNVEAASDCGRTVTPACLQKLYNTSGYKPKADTNTTLGVAGYLDEFANEKDLTTFLKKYLPDAANATFKTVQINDGGNDQNDPGVEANLDIQYTEALSYPIPNVYYSTGGSPPYNEDSQTPTNTNEPYLDWLEYILDQDDIPQTFTTSYGDDEQTVPQDYAQNVCDQLAKLGARGASILFSSGDFGVGGGDCANNDGSNATAFQPAFPASCPYVTTVGGTTGVNPEKAVDFSGGGFSRYFAQPDYQADAVSAYLDFWGDKNKDLFNSSGRAYPDLAAQGSGFQVVIGGITQSVGGTSASSPTVAGIIALLNDYKVSQGQSPLGFLNPLIYSTAADGFNDITEGTNPGCDTDGFEATKGWDPVTGLGTPDFAKLQKLV
ncbi:peptidase S8/S53 domain-containing protein [Schizophyllum commune]